jgi:hypothetical protein
MNLEEPEKFKEEWETTFEKLQKEKLVKKKTD